MQVVINSPGTMIKQKDECFLFKNQDKKLDLSPMKVESIIISNKAMISTQAISLALENNIDLVFLDRYGFPIGRVWFSKMGSTALIRRKQLDAANCELGLNLVLDLIRQKVNNQLAFLKKLKYARPDKKELFQAPLNTIEGSLEALDRNFKDLDESRLIIMGLEGTAGRAYFSCISKIMPEKFRFKGRSKRPAKNQFNAVLNYCYGVLYSRVEKACIIAGLDPFVGFMHTDNYNKKSLVFDLIEPFRIFAEQTAVYLFTGKKAKNEYFDIKEHSCSLNDKGKPVVIESLNRHLEEKVRYKRRNVKRKYIISHEAHKLANILLEDEAMAHPEWLDIKEF
ncbi:MAG: CRISPR-associated endonuclease Cas1 [Desulfobacula sp.]|nr:CRISPR-associated endonuclease Cas1 [Desulfobacula sp.]MBT3486572.1 CRISPR-associated endonuclease Cas1 [Desulfobacula sp.]MBT3805769.1 CRISPR-associated endonuclease Cas1 [Desulfobacula sp.]MBT4023952.1 CRISPR-associated endonuclease Cas1 [Desulfobacula sp.]MBT4200358.1 CRISPR-associated endonuclease Cas1 [Desulfobacula sp.]